MKMHQTKNTTSHVCTLFNTEAHRESLALKGIFAPTKIVLSDAAEPNDAEETAPKKVSNVEEMDVPDAVFGGLKKPDEK